MLSINMLKFLKYLNTFLFYIIVFLIELTFDLSIRIERRERELRESNHKCFFSIMSSQLSKSCTWWWTCFVFIPRQSAWFLLFSWVYNTNLIFLSLLLKPKLLN